VHNLLKHGDGNVHPSLQLPSHQPTLHLAFFCSPDMQLWHNSNHNQMLTQCNSHMTEMTM